MLNKVCIGLIALVAVACGVAGEALAEAEGVLMLLVALAGVVYGAVAIDAEDATAFLAVAIAVGLAAQADALSYINVVGEYLDAMLDVVPVALYSAVASILVMRTKNRLMG
ncbi:MAG: hypothetical protein OXM02_06135 [Bacteroidota bacterium]|nr:hypothetical protein [Bacteroidota bacterium]MDE2834084.1 hypothetical protein [Bacteroidota bacterium]MDE2955417.1 hypothetical protein [Bacteroidota bacterium]